MRSLFVVAAVLVPAVRALPPWQDEASTAPAEDCDAVLASLIARTNALRSFRAVYTLTKDGRKMERLEVIYDAPDRARVHRQAIDGQLDQRMWILDLAMHRRGLDEQGRDVGSDLDFAANELAPLTEILEHLDAEFPAPEPRPRLGVGFDILPHVASGPEDDQKVDFAVHRTWGEREAMLGWLPWARRAGMQSELTKDQIVARDAKGTTWAISRSSGFLERVEAPQSGGANTVLLESLVVDEAIDEAAFRVPPRSEASNVDTTAFLIPLSLNVRGTILRRLAAAKEAGGASWDADRQEGAKALLGSVHAQLASHLGRTYCDASRRRITEYAEWLGDRVEATGGDEATLEGLDQAFEEWRARFIDSAERRMWQILEDRHMRPPGDFPESLLELDRAAAEGAFREQVIAPLLTELDERVDAVFVR
jgi:hypothetical protein